jgi:predicted membrane-bound spermidine synthase
MGWFFLFFLISGFCSILYELIWLRLAMAAFGVTTALVSIVLSVFMAGLGLGSWGSGQLIRRLGDRISGLRTYALLELLIGVSALAVPSELHWGRLLLQQVVPGTSFGYYLASGLWVALTLIPWCACMGATIPVGMLAIQRIRSQARRSFSFLYLANVSGAVLGALIPPLLIELLGFRGTLKAGAVCNGMLTLGALTLSMAIGRDIGLVGTSGETATPAERPRFRGPLVLLFLTGLTSMGMEVVWIRQFTPYLGTVVYVFALILAIYLAMTSFGSALYRRWSLKNEYESWIPWALLGLTALLSLFTASPQAPLPSWIRVLIGIGPFTAVLGFVTPMLVDRWSGGDPERGGTAYAVNVVGCILGPLLAGFLLLPYMSERWALCVLALPWLVLAVWPEWGFSADGKHRVAQRPAFAPYAVAAAVVVLVATSRGFEDGFVQPVVLRDNTATVIATGDGMRKRLLVNGIGITYLTPVTKMMAHLPMAFLDHPPRQTLVVCFGMGTTYRSLLSWGVPATAVELVPSVPVLFGYYHADGPELLRSPLSHVVIDDGRRYLERTQGRYDVVTLDPPPPVKAAASSLLYSREFYAAVRARLAPGGILQQWLPEGDPTVQSAVMRALQGSFAHVRVFSSVEHWGFHFLASDDPVRDHTAAELVQRMPLSARVDLMEWGPEAAPEAQFERVLRGKINPEDMIGGLRDVPVMQDDRPVNEYYLLRRELRHESWEGEPWRATQAELTHRDRAAGSN